MQQKTKKKLQISNIVSELPPMEKLYFNIKNIKNNEKKQIIKKNSIEKRKQRNKEAFYQQIVSYEEQGKLLQNLIQNISKCSEEFIEEELECINLAKVIEYVTLKFNSLTDIITFLQIVSQLNNQYVEIILKSELFKNLLYQVCLTVSDQNILLYREMVRIQRNLHSIFLLFPSITDSLFTIIIYSIRLTEFVQKYSRSFEQCKQLQDSLKQFRYSNDYKECPVQPLMLEFDFKYQIIGNLEKSNYLNFHYFILREDYLREFRQFIYKFKTKTLKKNDKQFPMYQEAQLIDFDISNKDLIWTIKLKQYNMDGRQRQIWDWKNSKRLTSGSLLAFTNIQVYPIVFGVILERDINQPNYRRKFEINLSIKLLSFDIQQFLDLFKCSNIVIENPIIYDASTSYLLSLKTTQIPFKDIIVNGSEEVYVPSYIKNYNYSLCFQTKNNHNINNNGYVNSQTFTRKRNGSEIKNLLDEQWESQGSLDQSQMNALKLMLSAQIALVQGPPGTGKTFCGALAVRNLLTNVSAKALPILVLCYTNHALDQFLNHILNFVSHSDVLRLGFGCKDPNIIPCMVTSSKKVKIQFEWDKFNELKSLIKNLMVKIINQQYTVTNDDISTHWPELYESIVNDECVEDFNDEDQILTKWRQQSSNYYQTQIGCQQQQFKIDSDESVDQQDEEEDEEEEEEQDEDQVFDQNADEYLDSDEEAEARYFQEEFVTQINQNNSQKLQYNIFMKTITNKRIPYNYNKIAEFNNMIDPWNLKKDDIQCILDYISHLKLLQDIQKCSSLIKQFEKMSSKLKLKYQQANFDDFNSKKIIGVTITGAAKHTEILKQLDTKIMVIEEAAEVLESHLISILTPNIQHLILIGDHQQLKPKLSCYELEQQYGANTSLFQKLFEQGILNVTLTCQRRMKPKFADFIRLIYGNSYQDNIPEEQINTTIDGMNSDLVYFNHSWLEERDANTTSTQNTKEAKMIIELVIYLIGCMHLQETITVLCLYLKQALYIKKILTAKGLKDIKVKTVDNYQGEENEIVIISLVRSNMQGSIGFVKLENRINVALSRARVGLYVFGNFQCIKQNCSPSHIWTKVIGLANQKKVLKNHLELCCLRHKNVRYAQTPEEIRLLSPGCCDQICNGLLSSCTHKCIQKCHLGDHPTVECQQKCERILACSHQCPGKCYQKCQLFQCQQNVKKVLSCLHEAIVICSQQTNKVVCQEQVTKTYHCGHSFTYTCSQKTMQIQSFFRREKCDKQLYFGTLGSCRLRCSEQCNQCWVVVDVQLSCGHLQQFYCHQFTNQSYLNSKCVQMCNQVRECGHPNNCQFQCHQTLLCNPCDFIIQKTLKCGHSYPFQCCQLNNIDFCRQINNNCQQLVDQRLPCGHITQIKCQKYDNSNFQPVCKQNCIKVRKCGHSQEQPCFHPCNQPCPPCGVIITKLLQCEHEIKLYCYQMNNQFLICKQRTCNNKLICGHPNKCTKPCSQPCDPCIEIRQKVLQCGHVFEVYCYLKYQYMKCPLPCPKTTCSKCNSPLQCDNLCGDPCSPCSKRIIKQFPCGHTQQTTCGKSDTLINCCQIISRVMECGSHYENVPCNQYDYPRSKCTKHYCVIF